MKLLLCTDLDRTLLPNGSAPETDNIRTIFNEICNKLNITLAYISGRNESLLKQAIQTWDIPVPAVAAGDVGTRLFHIQDQEWQPDRDWEKEIIQDWNPITSEKIIQYLISITELRLQETNKQSNTKVSFYLDLDIDHSKVIQSMHNVLQKEDLKYTIVWSVDEETDIGLIDVLPENASKLHAVEYLAKKLGFKHDEILYAGDSGNDLPVFSSVIRSILVKNTHVNVISQIKSEIEKNIISPEHVYIAEGNNVTGNGNYASGIIEGLLHYYPSLSTQVNAIISNLNDL